MSDRPGPPPGDGETEPGCEVTDNDDDEAETNSLAGRELDQLLVVSRDDPEIDLESTAELSGEEIEQLLLWAEAQEDVDDGDQILDEATVEQEPDVTQAAIATLPMLRDPDARAPAISLAVLAPPMPAPPPPNFLRPPATSTPVIDVRAVNAELRSPRDAPRPPLVSADLPWRPKARSPLPTALVVAASAALAAGGIYTLIERGDEESPVAPPAAVAPDPPRPEPAIVRPPAADPRVDVVKKALRDLGDGLRECVKRSAMILPGSSPAVPARLEQTAGRGYEVAPNDFHTPVWTCTGFHVDSPMRFQIQWQLAKGSSEGLGIAWLDDDGDGKADHAFAFRATLKQRGQVEVGAVEPISPSRPTVPVAY